MRRNFMVPCYGMRTSADNSEPILSYRLWLSTQKDKIFLKYFIVQNFYMCAKFTQARDQVFVTAVNRINIA
jgi:hypothetical protein